MKYEDLSEEIRTTIHDEWNNFSNELVMKSEDGKFFLSDIAKAFYAGIDSVLKQLGWHPASELPPEEGEYIAIDNGMPGVFWVDYLEPFGWCVEVMGAHEVVNVKWWSYPPEKK